MPGFIVLMLAVSYGPWFRVHTAYSYLLMLIGALLLVQLLVQLFVRSRYLYRGQTGIPLFAAVVPWAGNAVYLSGANPLPGLDPTAIAFALPGALVLGAMFR